MDERDRLAKYGADPNVSWQHVRVAAYADRGRVNYEEFGKWEIIGPNESESGEWGGFDTWQKNNLLAQAAFHQAMFAWLETGLAPGTSLAESLHEWAVVLAVYQSALEHRSIDMSQFDPPADLFARLQKVLAK